MHLSWYVYVNHMIKNKCNKTPKNGIILLLTISLSKKQPGWFQRFFNSTCLYYK